MGLLRLVFLVLLVFSTIATAGSLTVIGDVNIGSATNDPFYLNVLGSSSNVLFARNNVSATSRMHTVVSNAGASVTVSNTTVTAAALTNRDLLIFNQSSFNAAMVYSSAELTVIGNFLQNGGDVLLIAETSSDFANLNNFLTGVGSSIQYLTRVNGSVTTILPHPLTTGVSSFSLSAFNTFSGGTSLMLDASGNTVVVTESIGNSSPPPVPEPNVFILAFLGLASLFLPRKK